MKAILLSNFALCVSIAALEILVPLFERATHVVGAVA